jgi:hypothetical protein
MTGFIHSVVKRMIKKEKLYLHLRIVILRVLRIPTCGSNLEHRGRITGFSYLKNLRAELFYLRKTTVLSNLLLLISMLDFK